MSSRRQKNKRELPTSTTSSINIRDIELEEKICRRPSTPLNSSEAEAAPIISREFRSPSVRSFPLVCTTSSGDVSSYTSDEPGSHSSWSMKYYEPKDEENGDPNENANKHPPGLETPPFRQPSPPEVDIDEDSFDGPPNPGEHVPLSRAETDAIIESLLNSSDGIFSEEFDENFDPAVVKFAIVPEVKEPREEGPITLYSTEEEDDSDNESKQVVVIDDETDDEEVKEICSRKPPLLVGKKNDGRCVPCIRSCADTTTKFGDPGPSTSSGGSVSMHTSRPSTSKAALNHIPRAGHAHAHSTTHFDAHTLGIAHMTDYHIAFAEVEQLLTEDNERNRLFFSGPSPPPQDRGVFKRRRIHRVSVQSQASVEGQANGDEAKWRQGVKI